tara:strand:+ start:435 stop:830 length:396 start_codon:yes stop_codon:yes gene_type:complete
VKASVDIGAGLLGEMPQAENQQRRPCFEPLALHPFVAEHPQLHPYLEPLAALGVWALPLVPPLALALVPLLMLPLVLLLVPLVPLVPLELLLAPLEQGASLEQAPEVVSLEGQRTDLAAAPSAAQLVEVEP